MKDTTNIAAELQSELRHFTGSENWYRYGLVKSIVYTDGVKHVADRAGAYWLIDQIALSQKFEKAVSAEPFQFWKLKVNADHSCVLSCEDGNGKTVLRKELEFTDFPLSEISFYFTDNTILLPSEY